MRGAHLLFWIGALVGGALASESLPVVSRAEYAGEMQRLVSVVEACRVRADACDAKLVPADQKATTERGDSYEIHWDWLRDALKKGADSRDKDRRLALDAAAQRLADDQAALGEARGEESDVAVRKAGEVLGRAEFRTAAQNSWWQRKLALAASWVDEFLGRAVDAVPWAPWMTVLVEWGLLAGAVAGLLVWVLRVSRQQRVGVVGERGPASTWQVESEDWAARARAEALAGNWREAVHCLYWSAIVMLEGQRLWRQNRARTPREYVGMLEAGSGRRMALGGLTGIFERIWYGVQPATAGDYEKAAELLEQLRVGG